MNLLAHAYLSGPDEAIQIGNFLGDFVKGDPAHPRHELSFGEQAGVRLHRRIDAFTDAHPEVKTLRELLRPRCGKYAGVAVDVLLDHVLAADFRRYTDQDLNTFTAAFYQTLHRNWDRLPLPARRMAEYMIRQDWLTNYRSLEGINRALQGMARRTTFPSGLDTVLQDLTGNYAIFAQQFARFFPDLPAHLRAEPEADRY